MTRQRRMSIGSTSTHEDSDAGAPAVSILVNFTDGEEVMALRRFNREVESVRRKIRRLMPSSLDEAEAALAQGHFEWTTGATRDGSATYAKAAREAVLDSAAANGWSVEQMIDQLELQRLRLITPKGRP